MGKVGGDSEVRRSDNSKVGGLSVVIWFNRVVASGGVADPIELNKVRGVDVDGRITDVGGVAKVGGVAEVGKVAEDGRVADVGGVVELGGTAEVGGVDGAEDGGFSVFI